METFTQSEQAEQQYLALRAQLEAELSSIQKQVENLENRRLRLEAVLNGTAVVDVSEPEPSDELPEQRKPKKKTPVVTDAALQKLVSLIQEMPGINRAELQEKWGTKTRDSKVLTRALETARRRKLIYTQGSGRAAAWYPTDEG